MKIFYKILLLSFLLSNKLAAQEFTQTIRGTVTDKTTNTPIPGANIIIVDSSPFMGVASDIDGKFRLENIKIGRVDLKVSFVGYNDVFLTDLLLTSGKEMVLAVEMEERVMSFKEMVVSGSSDKTEPINKMTALSSRIFTVEETELYAGARSDVGRMASNFAGVVGNNDARNDIVIRGNTPSGLLWRLEGVDIPNPNHFAAFGTSGGPICMLKNSMLSNSDFITSAFPAEYGNAISGVFDLKMRNGNNEKHEFMAQMGFNGLEAGAEGPISKKNVSSYIFDYSYSILDLFSKFNIELGTGSAIPRYQDLALKLNFPKTKFGHITFFGLGGISNIALQDSKKDTTKEKIDFYGIEGWDIINHSTTGIAGLSDIYIFNNKTYAKITFAAIYHEFTADKDSVVPATLMTVPYEGSRFTEEKSFVSLFISKKINAHHNCKVGASVTWMAYDLIDSLYFAGNNQFRNITGYKGTTSLLQPYFQWQYKILNNLTINTGLHYQYLSYNKTGSLEPRIGFKWGFAPVHSLNVGFGMHSQTVPITVFYRQVQLPDGSIIKTNDQLGFLHSKHFVVGYDWKIAEFMRFKTELYYQKIIDVPVDGSETSDFSVLNLGANFDFWSPDTLIGSGTGENYGLEFTLERFLHKELYFLLTSSVYNSKYKGSDGVERNTIFNGNYSVNFLAGKEFILKSKKKEKRQKSFIFNLKSIYCGGQRYTPINIDESILNQTTVFDDLHAFSRQFPPYSRTDLKISFKMNGKKITIEWALEIMNIFDQKNVYSQYFNRKQGEVYYTYQLGRTLMPQYKITF
ncbi:MAG: TonB-dependent receptor [Bacteroidota bacterium]